MRVEQVEQAGGAAADLRKRFNDLKKKLSGLFVRYFTICEVMELAEYVSGKYDPTPTCSDAEVQKHVSRMQVLLQMGQPKA